MAKKPVYEEPVSLTLKRHPHGDKAEIVSTICWAARVCLSVFPTLIFSVRDNGNGIAPERHDRIFELFSKLNPGLDGTAIGLGLVKRIIEVHTGKKYG
jgi:signal transduction histidine kinase